MLLIAVRVFLVLAGLNFLFSCQKKAEVTIFDASVLKDATHRDVSLDSGKTSDVAMMATVRTDALSRSAVRSTLLLSNRTKIAASFSVSFGAGSQIKATDWKAFCTVKSELNCSGLLMPKSTQGLPLSGKHLNATISFVGAGCGATKAEVDMNNPAWFDTYDVSLVDGYNYPVSIEVVGGSMVKLGPPKGKAGNERVFGVFPLGCDVCTARLNPPCGISPGTSGCKHGTQYKPDVPCQYQGPTKGGGGVAVSIYLD